jgi:hypothetical protein
MVSEHDLIADGIYCREKAVCLEVKNQMRIVFVAEGGTTTACTRPPTRDFSISLAGRAAGDAGH